MTAEFSPAPLGAGVVGALCLTTDVAAGRVTVVGDLDRDSAHLLLHAVAALARGDRRTWTVDAAGITFCDAEGLRALARARALAEDRGRVLVVDRPGRFLLRLLAVVGMGEARSSTSRGTASLTVVPDVDAEGGPSGGSSSA